jgi:DNA-binding transcriptional LysR family regulator
MDAGAAPPNSFDSVSFLHLRYFLAVADHGSVTSAADALTVAQPSLSQQLRQLEKRCGVALFIRSSTGMELTAAGCMLRDLAVDGIAVMRTLRGPASERLVVGVPRGVRSDVLDAARGALGDRVHISFAPADSSRHAALLDTGALDAAIVRGPRPPSTYPERLLARHTMDVVLADQHPLAGRDQLRWADLADDELLWFDSRRAPEYSAAVIAALDERGWKPKLRIVNTSSDALFRDALVRGGRIVALRPAEHQGQPQGIVAIPIDDPVFEEFHLVSRARLSAEL